MQSLEHKVSILVTRDVHERIVALRRGKQTYGDVVAESITALEEKNNAKDLPRFEDLDEEALEQMDKEVSDDEKKKHYITLEQSIMDYEKEHLKT